ncbi:MAG: hypothetical protein ABEH59_12250 [Halobacteriales archaeon]
MSYDVGDRVRVVIPEDDDPDYRYHDKDGEIEAVLQDDLSGITGDLRDDFLYRVVFQDEALGRISFRHHDLERVA